MNKDFLKNLKAGDRIGYETNYAQGIKKIKRITKTMIILSNGSRYNKDTGNSVGDNIWSSDRLIEITEKWEQDLHRGIMRNKVRHYIKEGLLSKVSDEELEKIYTILKNKENKK